MTSLTNTRGITENLSNRAAIFLIKHKLMDVDANVGFAIIDNCRYDIGEIVIDVLESDLRKKIFVIRDFDYDDNKVSLKRALFKYYPKVAFKYMGKRYLSIEAYIKHLKLRPALYKEASKEYQELKKMRNILYVFLDRFEDLWDADSTLSANALSDDGDYY